jgi:predicted TIM-barrel fold metal-dependent hydrolase
MRSRLLDPLDIEYAILTAGEILSVSAVPNGALAAALASAYNRWLAAEWLPRDRRLKGSLVVAPQEPERAAAEIRELGEHPDIVQVVVSCGAAAGYGDARYEPIWAACEEVGLPLALHPGAEGIGVNAPPTSTGYPGTEFEYRTLLPTAAMSHLVSIVAHGIFRRFANVGLAILQSGVTWLPPLLSQLDANRHVLGGDTHVDELPSETVMGRVRLTTQPGETPPAGLDAILMLASDYPRTDLGGPPHAVRMAGSWNDAVASRNARTFYRLPERAADAG